MKSLEPSPNLVPSEVPASGHHGYVKWGHDAKFTKIGIILTRGSPSQGKGNDPQDGRQNLGPISECTTWNWVPTQHGQRDMGPPIDHTGKPNRGPKRGSFWLLKTSQRLALLPKVYLHASLEIGSAIPYAIHQESKRRLPCTWLPKIFMPLGVVTIPIGSTNAKMAKLSTLTLG